MSLDVYLEADTPRPVQPGSGIFVREAGSTVEIGREEWDRRYPGREPVIYREPEGVTTRTLYHANITHNLGRMAEAAGVYEALWRPEEIGVSKAAQLAPLLCDGLAGLLSDPGKHRAFNPANGWGDYDGFVRFVARYLAACLDHPGARVRVSR